MSGPCPALRRVAQDSLQNAGCCRFAAEVPECCAGGRRRTAPDQLGRLGRTKRPQTYTVLKFPELLDETRNMPLPLTSTDRQLVFTSSQAARYLGVSLATIRRWTDAGHVSCYRTPGGQRRFSRDQLDSFIASMHRSGHAGRAASTEQRSASVA
jgi:excisionase family DNA binding protein